MSLLSCKQGSSMRINYDDLLPVIPISFLAFDRAINQWTHNSLSQDCSSRRPRPRQPINPTQWFGLNGPNSNKKHYSISGMQGQLIVEGLLNDLTSFVIIPGMMIHLSEADETPVFATISEPRLFHNFQSSLLNWTILYKSGSNCQAQCAEAVS